MNIVKLNSAFGFTDKIEYDNGDVSFVGNDPLGNHWSVQFGKFSLVAHIQDKQGNMLTFEFEAVSPEQYSGFDASIMIKHIFKSTRMIVKTHGLKTLALHLGGVNGHVLTAMHYSPIDKGSITVYDRYNA